MTLKTHRYEFMANESYLRIPYTGLMSIEGNIKDAALALAQHIFKLPVDERKVRKTYGNIIILYHNDKYTVHLSPTLDLKEYPEWFFEFQENFNKICDKLAIFM